MPSLTVIVLFLFAFGCNGTRELAIVALGPFADPLRTPDWLGGPALIPAARQAVDDINNRPDILGGFNLTLLEGDSGCEYVHKTIINFTDLVFHHELSSQVVGVVGPGCSASAIALSSLIAHPKLNLMQVSIATTPDINSFAFNNSFRTVGSSLVFVDAYSKLIENAQWGKVGAVYDSERPFHITTYSEFRKKVGDGVLDFSFSLRNSISGLATGIKEKCLRVVFVFAGRDKSRMVLCSALKNNLVYPNVQFLFVERVREDFTTEPVFLDANQSCSAVDMEHALDGMILINNRLNRNDLNSTNTEAGISFNEFNMTYQSYLDKYVNERGINRSTIPETAPLYSSGYYDAVWALALALNETGTMHDLSQIEAKEIGSDMRESLKSLAFEGMSGLIAFDKHWKDVPTIGAVLSQCTKIECAVVGNFTNGDLDFNGHTIRHDFDTNIYEIPLPLGIFMVAVGVLMAVLLVLVQVAFCKYSDVKEVKATSPHLNHLMFSGCYLFILVLLIFTIQNTFAESLSKQPVLYGVQCSTFYWAFALGFTLIFGTVASKTWRVYRIFSHFKQGRVRFASDEFLLLFVAFFLSIDVGLLTAWNVLDPWELLIFIRSKEGAERTEQLLCTCNNYTAWVASLFLSKAFLAALLVVLSVCVRHIKRKSFKSTKKVIVLLYILIINFVIGFTLYLLFLTSIPILSFLGLSLSLVISVILISFSLFLSYIWPLITDRFLPGNTLRTSSGDSGTVTSLPGTAYSLQRSPGYRASLQRSTSLQRSSTSLQLSTFYMQKYGVTSPNMPPKVIT